MFIKKIPKKDLSVERLKRVVEICGDDCVTGYVRYKKIKPIKGYKKACRRASLHMSRIVGGRVLENENYAAVVSFNYAFFILPVIICAMLGVLIGRQVKAKEPEETTAVVYEPEGTVPADNEYTQLYISVPGYSDCNITVEKPLMMFYNPVGNPCTMRYRLYIRDSLIYETESLISGERCAFDMRSVTKEGSYSLRIEAVPYSIDGDMPFNTVTQEIQINVY